jgi:acetyltransferase EpsM
MSKPVYIPLINPNEPEALLATLPVRLGQQVQPGDLLCTLETTKSTHEVLAEAGGFVAGLAVEAGQTLRAGDLLCYLAETPDWQPPQEEQTVERSEADAEVLPHGLRITQPALALARARGLDLAALPRDVLVTEKQVRAQTAPETPAQSLVQTLDGDFDPMAIVIYGCGGHGKSVADLLHALGSYRIVGFIDDGVPAGELVMGYPVLGGGEQLAALASQGVRLAVNAVGGIGNLGVRLSVFERLAAAGFANPAVVHPRAFLEPGARLEAGVQVFPFAYVGSDVRVGFGSIINTGAIVSHDCVIEAYANVSPGATLAGGVRIGRGALIGMRATVNLLVNVGAGARIGNGATVKADIPEGAVVTAGGIWPRT